MSIKTEFRGDLIVGYNKTFKHIELKREGEWADPSFIINMTEGRNLLKMLKKLFKDIEN